MILRILEIFSRPSDLGSGFENARDKRVEKYISALECFFPILTGGNFWSDYGNKQLVSGTRN